ncbi:MULTISPECIES: TetR family transcriptional regulator [unclassified Crossiella]|uniref:TetR family transcriptional regulator n=1 Tax=unclassified Crossiella TaxID=2620835 RepID=UPI0020005AB3|nr:MULTISPECIES: TetR family transcriptional regulator [unclassified Crossiella]MCK2238361.1 TetR family transcriptional regulator [Crossiella sp. S99.2]MCK2256401.1 TetR family transcriptional regulator [Crossiella sp. S99.1]
MSKKTFTETARRAQIVAAAIETLAELGHARTSFARIAKRAGLSSTGLISYHFAGKEELITEVAATVLAEFREHVLPRMAGLDSAGAQLRAFLLANFDFMAAHRPKLLALLEIGQVLRPSAGDPGLLESDLAGLAELLREGQRRGEFREFDPKVLALAIRSVRDGVLRRLAAEPELDLAACAVEVVRMFELATCEPGETWAGEQRD